MTVAKHVGKLNVFLCSRSTDYDDYYYYVTHTRLAPWLIGIAFGAFIYQQKLEKTKFKIKQVSLII